MKRKAQFSSNWRRSVGSSFLCEAWRKDSIQENGLIVGICWICFGIIELKCLASLWNSAWERQLAGSGHDLRFHRTSIVCNRACLLRVENQFCLIINYDMTRRWVAYTTGRQVLYHLPRGVFCLTLSDLFDTAPSSATMRNPLATNVCPTRLTPRNFYYEHSAIKL